MKKLMLIVFASLITKFCTAQDSLIIKLTMDGKTDIYSIVKIDNTMFVLKCDKRYYITMERKGDSFLFSLKKKNRIMKCELPMYWLNGNELNLKFYKTKKIFYRKGYWLEAVSGSHALSCEVTFEKIN